MPPKPITYNSDLERLLKEQSEECESLSILHRMSYEKYNKRSNYINIPVIILSSAIGFITGIDLQYDQMNIILGVGSVFVGIIKSVDTYFQLAKRAESHRICSLQFSQISKKMQVELTLHRNQRLTAENMMNIVKTDIKNMQDIAPLIDDDIIEMYNAKYRKYKRVKKPNFVNGLTEVKVNPHNNEDEYEYASRQGSREASPSLNNQNQNDDRAPSTEQFEQQPLSFKTLEQQQNDDDNKSVEPIQTTVIPTANISQSFRKSPSLSAEVQPVQELSQKQNQLPILDNLQLLQLYQQLQSQVNVNSKSKSPSAMAATAAAAATATVTSPLSIPNSPASSVKSNTSTLLGQIQTDNSGNHVVSI